MAKKDTYDAEQYLGTGGAGGSPEASGNVYRKYLNEKV